jgi:hypothetical protein
VKLCGWRLGHSSPVRYGIYLGLNKSGQNSISLWRRGPVGQKGRPNEIYLSHSSNQAAAMRSAKIIGEFLGVAVIVDPQIAP